MTQSVAIVGGGFSGTVLAAELLRSSPQPIAIRLFERTGEFGAGLAYSTQDSQHLLNVPASKMSALEEQSDHFAEWLIKNKILGPETPDTAFIPRKHYRQYLSDLLEEAANDSSSDLIRVADEVVGVDPVVETESGDRFKADFVVLATGHLPETNLKCQACFSPFRPDSWPSQDVKEVVLIGSGLTALDATTTVFNKYPSAKITAISRSGRMPERFDATAPVRQLGEYKRPSEVRSLLKWLRSEIALAEAQGVGWQSVFNAMRPKWDGIWQDLPPLEQRRFLNHLWRLFDRHRHRVPPKTADAIGAHIDNGSFRILKGVVTEVRPNQVVFTDSGKPQTIAADLIIDCSGQSQRWNRSQDPLVLKLLADAKIAPGPHNMGISADKTGQIGGPESRFFAIGPMLRGVRWETTAVAELRKQAAEVRKAILHLLKSGS